MKSITQQRLAELANVSVSTVSKAFANSNEISEKTRNRIFELAKEYGCFAKYYSGTPTTKVIAVIANEIKENVYTKGLKHLDKIIRQDGNVMLVAYSNYSQQTRQYLMDYFTTYAKVDGLIVFSSLKELTVSNLDIPIVAFSSKSSAQNKQIADRIVWDMNTITDRAISYLMQNGHTDIAYVGEFLSKSKREIFKTVMQKHNLPVPDEFVRTSRLRLEEAGYSEMKELLSLPKRPTAIFCAYDTIAHGVISCIKDSGFSVPDDFSVISMDNIDTSAMGYNLTTFQKVDISFYDMAYELLLKRMDNPYIPKQTIMASPRFVERGSVRNLREL